MSRGWVISEVSILLFRLRCGNLSVDDNIHASSCHSKPKQNNLLPGLMAFAPPRYLFSTHQKPTRPGRLSCRHASQAGRDAPGLSSLPTLALREGPPLFGREGKERKRAGFAKLA